MVDTTSVSRDRRGDKCIASSGGVLMLQFFFWLGNVVCSDCDVVTWKVFQKHVIKFTCRHETCVRVYGVQYTRFSSYEIKWKCWFVTRCAFLRKCRKISPRLMPWDHQVHVSAKTAHVDVFTSFWNVLYKWLWLLFETVFCDIWRF